MLQILATPDQYPVKRHIYRKRDRHGIYFSNTEYSIMTQYGGFGVRMMGTGFDRACVAARKAEALAQRK